MHRKCQFDAMRQIDFWIDTMIYIIYAVSILFCVIFTTLIKRKEEKEREKIHKILADMIQPETNPWIASEYLSRIEKASIEIQNQRQPINKIIVLWWGLDGLRLNEDGSLEWISRKKKEPKKEPTNQNVFHQPPQYIAMAQTTHPLDMRNMCQSTMVQIEELHEKLDAFKMQNATQGINAQVVAQMSLPHLQTIYPYGYIPFPQYPYTQYFYGGMDGCYNQTIF